MTDSLATAYVTILPDLDGFPATLRAGLTAAMVGVSPDVPVGADTSGADAAIAQVGVAAAALRPSVPVGADTSIANAKLAITKAMADAIGRERPEIVVGADTSGADAAIAALAAARTSVGAAALAQLFTSGAAVDPSVIAALSAARTAEGASAIAAALGLAGGIGRGGDSGGGDSGGGGGGLGSSFWGTGGMLGMAAFGSLASMMGFGFEHLIAMAIGTAGSMIGGMIGGGLLGLGAIGTAGVGFGTDLAGIGQAAGDIKNVYGPLTSLQSALSNYGSTSVQAAQAQDALNSALDGFSPVAQNAVSSAVTTASQFKAIFDQVSGQAEALGAGIINQAIKVGEQFLPTIGKFATENMGIIQNALQPLFTWLTDSSRWGGLGIFKDLETLFQQRLPYAMGALTNGFELLGKTVDIAAQYGGHFLMSMDEFFTRMNTTDFAKWSSWVQNMIGLFSAWAGTIVAVARTIYDIFMPAVGAGKAIAEFLTGTLDQIDKFLTSSSMTSAMHDLFSVHLVELIQGIGGVIQGVLPFLEGFALAFTHVLTAGATVATAVLIPIADALKALAGIPGLTTFLGWAGALAIAIPAVVGFGGALVAFVRGPLAALVATAWGNIAGGIDLLSSAFIDGETGALAFGAGLAALGPFVAIAATIAGAAYLYTSSLHDMKAAQESLASSSGLTAALALPTGGNNISELENKYRSLADSVSSLSEKLRGLGSADQLGGWGKDLSAAADAMHATYQQMTNLTDNTSFLAQHFHITADAADQLATAAGVDLTKRMGDGSMAIAAIQAQLDQMGSQAGLTGQQVLAMASSTNLSMTQLMQGVTQAVQSMTSAWASFTDPVAGVAAFMQAQQSQATATAAAQQAGASASQQLSSANQGLAKGNASLALANSDYALAQSRYNAELAKGSGASSLALQQYQVAMQSASDRIASAQDSIANAQQGVTSAYGAQQSAAQQAASAQVSYVNGIQTSLIPTAAAISGFYSQTLAQANGWVQNIQTALADGYSPAVIDQIISQGPQKAGPLLQGLVSNYSASLVAMVNMSSSALASIGGGAIEQARLMQIAVNAKTSDIASEESAALAAATTLTATATGQQIATFMAQYSANMPQFLKIVNDYGIALPDNVISQLGLTGSAGNYQAGAYTGALSANAPNATAAGGNLAASATAGMSSAAALQLAANAGGNLAANLLGGLSGANATPPADSLVTAIWNAIVTAQQNNDWPSLGRAIVNAVQAGITDSTLVFDPYLSAAPGGGYTYGGNFAGYTPTPGAGLPRYAAGGYVSDPTIAWVADAGPELILPLSDRARTQSLMAQYASVLGGPSTLGPGGSGFLAPTAVNATGGMSVTFGNVIVHGADTSNPAATKQAVLDALHTYTDELTQLVEAGQRPPGG